MENEGHIKGSHNIQVLIYVLETLFTDKWTLNLKKKTVGEERNQILFSSSNIKPHNITQQRIKKHGISYPWWTGILETVKPNKPFFLQVLFLGIHSKQQEK